MGTARNVFAIAVFPTVLGASLWGTWVLMERGLDPALALGPAVVVSYLFLLAAERVVPFRGAWLRSRGDVPVDLGHLMVSGVLTLQALQPLMLGLAVAVGGWLSGFAPDGFWPTRWPMAAQLVVALVVGEFFQYWVHRLGHEWDWLWRFHALHHSAPRLYFLNAVRFHPVDLAISNFAPFVPLVALGASPELMALFAVVSAVHGAFQHANVPIRIGPLNWFFAMAELHRWHHSRLLIESNTNFGQNLIVWDVVFGTRYLPAHREPPDDIGLTDLPAFPMDYWGQLLSPVRWRRIHVESGYPEETAADLQLR
jgi:sterol desaturase/sphingolipid hydroxylase (fatty acid hydroxylase superfamily)